MLLLPDRLASPVAAQPNLLQVSPSDRPFTVKLLSCWYFRIAAHTVDRPVIIAAALQLSLGTALSGEGDSSRGISGRLATQHLRMVVSLPAAGVVTNLIDGWL